MKVNEIVDKFPFSMYNRYRFEIFQFNTFTWNEATKEHDIPNNRLVGHFTDKRYLMEYDPISQVEGKTNTEVIMRMWEYLIVNNFIDRNGNEIPSQEREIPLKFDRR